MIKKSSLLASLLSSSYSALCALAPVKKRHILTRGNRLRLRYATSSLALLGVLGFAAFNTPAPSQELIAFNVPQHGSESLAELIAKNEADGQSASLGLVSAIGHAPRSQQALEEVKPALQAKKLTVEVGKGETLRAALMDAGLPRDDAQEIMNEVAGEYNLRDLKAGQKFDVSLKPNFEGSSYQLASMTMKIDPIRTLNVTRDEDGSIVAELDEKEVQKVTKAARIVMNGSIYASADKVGLPDRVTARAIKLFSHKVDFQRDLDDGDKLEILYESSETKDGYIAKSGDILFARLIIDGKERSLYRFQNENGDFDYYDEKGNSLKKGEGLLRTPVAYGRVTSGFGMRRHPVLGYTKMHKGIDFGAPTGTPIYAAGDGVVEKVGRFGAYGNYIRIRHNSKLHTAYAHISRYASGIKPGTRVKQGQTIAYVGNTGRSTGPHLHFEVHVNGVAVNPSSVKVASDNSLGGNRLKKFRQHVEATKMQYVRLASALNVASAPQADTTKKQAN